MLRLLRIPGARLQNVLRNVLPSAESSVPHTSEKEPALSIIAGTKEFILQGGIQISPRFPAVLFASVGNKVLATSSLEGRPFRQTSFELVIQREEIDENSKLPLHITLVNGQAEIVKSLPVKQLFVSTTLTETLKAIPLDVLAPSYGYFGGPRKDDGLTVTIDDTVTEICLQIDAEQSILNLTSVLMYNDKGEHIRASDAIVVSASSSKSTVEQLQRIPEKSPFHSNREDYPWLKFTFSRPTAVSTIRIQSRMDKWGLRSKRLTVSSTDAQGLTHQLYSAYSNDALNHFYAELAALLPDDNTLVLRGADASRQIVAFLNEYIRKDLTIDQRPLCAFAMQFTHIWPKDESTSVVLKEDLRLLALYVYFSLRIHMTIQLRSFCTLLPRHSDVEYLEEEINLLLRAAGMSEIKLTKHGAAKRGMLTQNIPLVLEVLEEVMSDLTSLGYSPCLAYGTLLGAVRDKQFIAHDDDVDILVDIADKPTNYNEAIEYRKKMIEGLDPKKYRIGYGVEKNLNIHIHHRTKKIMIDVFPYWLENGKAKLHMEKMKIRGIDPSIFASRGTISLYDKTFPIPGQPEAFLLERYGEGWPISDKYHEWPWDIKE